MAEANPEVGTNFDAPNNKFTACLLFNSESVKDCNILLALALAVPFLANPFPSN